MATTTLNISLPDTMRFFIEERIKSDGYSTASEYVRELIREDQKRREQAKLETMLLKSLEGEKATLLTKEDFESIKERGLERLQRQKTR